MTREELRKEATMTVEWECTPMINRPLFVHAYITGAEPREKRIAELEKQLYLMKFVLPEEYKQCNLLWKPVYDEYRKIGYRLKKQDIQNELFT